MSIQRKGPGQWRRKRLPTDRTLRCGLCEDVIVDEYALVSAGKWRHDDDQMGRARCPVPEWDDQPRWDD